MSKTTIILMLAKDTFKRSFIASRNFEKQLKQFDVIAQSMDDTFVLSYYVYRWRYPLCKSLKHTPQSDQILNNKAPSAKRYKLKRSIRKWLVKKH